MSPDAEEDRAAFIMTTELQIKHKCSRDIRLK